MADNPATIAFGSTPLAPVTPTPSATDAPKTISFGSKPLVAPPAPVTPVVTPPTPTSFGSHVTDFFKGLYNYSKNVVDAGANPIKEAAQKVIADVQSNNGSLTSSLSKGVDVAGDVAGGVVKTFGGLLNSAVIKPVADLNSMNPVVKAVANSDAGGVALDAIGHAEKFLTDKWNQFEAAHPEAAKKVADTGNIAQFMSLFVGDNPDVQVKGAEVAQKVADTAQKVVDTTATAAKEVPTIVSNIADEAKTGLENRYVSKTVDDWERVGGDYVKTDKILSREQAQIENPNAPKAIQDTPTFLSEHGIAPQSLIKDGKFDTAGVSEKLTGDAIKPFEDTLTAQLKVAQEGQPPVSWQEAREAVSKQIEQTRGLTAGDIEAKQVEAAKEIDALERRYPKGIPLDQLNVEKGTYWKNTKFDTTRPLKSQVNYDIGSAFKNIIETKAGDANVRELNAVLGNYYKAGKFLDGLNGKVPKLTVGQKIVRGVTKGVLTGVGEKVFGLSGGVGGFLLSKSVAQVLENVSNPVRALILNNLKASDPAAYTEAIKWLGEKEAERLSRPLLEAPAELGSDKNPIITPAPKTDTTVIEKPAASINRVNSKPGQTIQQMMEDAHKRGALEAFLNEPYVSPDQLPTIK